MFNVSSAEEALAIARDLCQRHRSLISHSDNESARDAALRVILAEAASPGSFSPPRQNHHRQSVSAANNNSFNGAAVAMSPPPRRARSSSRVTSALQQQMANNSGLRRGHLDAAANNSSGSFLPDSPSGTFRPPHHSNGRAGSLGNASTEDGAGSVGGFGGLGAASSVGGSTRRTRGPSGKSAGCFYCNEPTSRFCKETGRRHENGTEKAIRQWRRIYRQLALASSFVSSARLAKVNTCVEEYTIELNLDDI